MLFFVIKKYQLKGLVYCFWANGIYEVLKSAYGMGETEYRLLVFRYLFVIAAGVYIAMCRLPAKKAVVIWSSLCVLIGGGFIFLFSYTTYMSKIITFWRESSFIVCLFIIPILRIGLMKAHWSFSPLEILGKASFNIFLVQMIYYNFAERIYALVSLRGIQLLINIAFCVGVGVLFYFIEQPLTKWVVRKMKRLFVKSNKKNMGE